MSGINEFVTAWFPVVATVGGVAATWALWFINSRIDRRVDKAVDEVNQRTDQIVDTLKTRVDEQHDRIVQLEANWETLPTRDDFHRMAIQVERMGGDLKAMIEKLAAQSEKVDAVQRSVQRVNDYLLNEKAT